MSERIRGAIDQASRVLEADRRGPVKQASEVPHRWEDKYLMAEWLTDTMAAQHVHALSRVGLGHKDLEQLRQWALNNESVYLIFETEQRCNFIEKREREVESPTVEVETSTGGGGFFGGSVETVRTKVKRKVPEWVWNAQSDFSVIAARGKGEGPHDRLTIASRGAATELLTTTEHSPIETMRRKAPTGELVVDITWLVRMLEVSPNALEPSFSIDREHRTCATPRRNREVEAVLDKSSKLRDWAFGVNQYMEALASTAGLTPVDLSVVSEITPLLPLLRDRPNSTCILERIDTNALLEDAQKKLANRSERSRSLYPNSEQRGVLFSTKEADMMLSLEYIAQCARQHRQALDYIENMVNEQLVAAIGSHVTPEDFKEYTKHHNRNLLHSAYAPNPFSVVIRRSKHHSPEGTLSLEQAQGGPVLTLAATAPNTGPPMSLPLDASTSVSFTGTRHLHSYLDHRFSTGPSEPVSLVARARQFSSMILVLGKIVGETGFNPTHAVLVQNKDELTIPLSLAALPTPKAFKEAVESLSPTQRAFAKEVRSLQLESTLFGALVIQVKPQLERVLNLPPNSLTKEIALTQQLMNLLVEHEIPSDLLSFSSPNRPEGVEATVEQMDEPLEAVRKHANAMSNMLELAKKSEADERERQKKHDEERAQAFRSKRSAGRARAVPDDIETGAAGIPEMMMAMQDSHYSLSAAPAMQKTAGAQRPQRASGQAKSVNEAEDHVNAAPRGERARGSSGGAVDYTRIVAEMDERIEALDVDGSLRPTIIDVKGAWTRKRRKGLLGGESRASVDQEAQKSEMVTAFGLLDALTRAGGLPLEDAALHVIVAATHQFDKSVMETLVMDNINPIERVERSTLILGSSVHRVPCKTLVNPAALTRVMATSPTLFIETAKADSTHAHDPTHPST